MVGITSPMMARGLAEKYLRTLFASKNYISELLSKKMKAGDWKWEEKNGLLMPIVPFTEKNVDTHCNCPACLYLKSSRCTSERCWFWQENPDKRHVSDPRMMGSTEHNMGRVAHNAFVFAWLIEQIERLNTLADESAITQENAWLLNWKTVEVME